MGWELLCFLLGEDPRNMEASIPWFSCLVELRSDQEKDNKEKLSNYFKSHGNSYVPRELRLGYIHRWTVGVRLRLPSGS